MAGNITTNVVQLGDSATASRNFHLQTNVDGTLSLNRGNVGTPTQEILRVAGTETVQRIQTFTAQASTAGTSIDFTGIPSWAKEITVMFNGVSTNGTSIVQIQIGNTTFTTTGYSTQSSAIDGTAAGTTAAGSGFILDPGGSAAFSRFGQAVISLITNNQYVFTSVLGVAGSAQARTHYTGGGSPALAGPLDRIRITTVNGTDVFDTGSINIFVKG